MRILLLSGYHAASHAYWCQQLRQILPQAQWLELSLPPRHFSWRTRGSSLAFATHYRAQIEAFEPTMVVATSMVDMAALRGFFPQYSTLPWVCYFHENQFAYPNSVERKGLVDQQLTSIYSALSADTILFNSQFNLASFRQGAKRLFKKLPDFSSPEMIDSLLAKAHVLPVPIASDAFRRDESADAPPSIVWNHRWEYDKGPDRLALLVDTLVQKQFDFTLHIVGQRFRRVPDALQQLLTKYEGSRYLGQIGYMGERQDYLDLLAGATHVLSTAIHDFQGLSLLEGAAAGCSVIAPARLAYPEWFAQQCHQSSAQPSEEEAEAAIEVLMRPRENADVSCLSAVTLAPAYLEIFSL
ncbi:DUF3524 domain-containing protein [uncultured Umboniibacter sp.]|uniref:tRNA-queuosine alpha-mannosyltransferase domain-containing protein n=1 Tax=uncultured Umboniibacter sp. TaxID=1798917 RepID=UPI00261A61C7|nr:DUF3524 domain-containing protein [uncultured Umboniibacter sp.]